MTNITKILGYSEFIVECKFFYCKNPDVYGPSWSGTEDYIIASDTPEIILLEKYPEIMKALSPYLFCDAACGAAIADGMRNTQKYQKRNALFAHYSLDEDFEQNIATQEEGLCANPLEMLEVKMLIDEALKSCTKNEKERIIKYYFECMTMKEIADGVSPKNVWLALNAGLKKMKKYFDQLP